MTELVTEIKKKVGDRQSEGGLSYKKIPVSLLRQNYFLLNSPFSVQYPFPFFHVKKSNLAEVSPGIVLVQCAAGG